MSRIPNAFKDGTAFIGFLTAGDPTIEKTVEYILAMDEAGCDLIEIGIPFSDPMAEGVVIQDANVRALKHNTTTDDVFDIVEKVRAKTDVPIVFLTAHADIDHIKSVLDLKPAGYLVKPVKGDVLKAEIKKHLEL